MYQIVLYALPFYSTIVSRVICLDVYFDVHIARWQFMYDICPPIRKSSRVTWIHLEPHTSSQQYRSWPSSRTAGCNGAGRRGNHWKWNSTETVDGSRARNSPETVDGGRARNSTETVDGGRARNNTETVDGGRARNSTETMDGGMAKNSTETVDGGRARNSTETVDGGRARNSTEKVDGGRARNS